MLLRANGARHWTQMGTSALICGQGDEALPFVATFATDTSIVRLRSRIVHGCFTAPRLRSKISAGELALAENHDMGGGATILRSEELRETPPALYKLYDHKTSGLLVHVRISLRGGVDRRCAVRDHKITRRIRTSQARPSQSCLPTRLTSTALVIDPAARLSARSPHWNDHACHRRHRPYRPHSAPVRADRDRVADGRRHAVLGQSRRAAAGHLRHQ
jgi:hypothetical protein